MSCIICLKNLSKDEDVTATERGSATLKRSADARKNKIDPKNEEAIVRIESTNSFKYHRSCYATFTSNTNISRLANRTANENSNLQPTSAIHSNESREIACLADWEKCILCQQVKKCDKDLRNVKSASMDAVIKSFGNFDELLSTRIASGSINLTGLARYHLSCLNMYQGKLNKISAPVSSQSVAFSKIISTLRSDGNDGKVRHHNFYFSFKKSALRGRS